MLMMFFYMFIFSQFLFYTAIYMMMKNLMFILEIELFKILSMKIEYLIMMDWISVMFMSLVMFISSMVLLFSFEYMDGEIKIQQFLWLVLLFVVSMMMMIMSPNMISILIGWDGLGLVSYCLVIYYQNNSSYNSGMVTVLTNRIGDALILTLISLFIFKGTWSFFMVNKLPIFLLMLVVIVTFTKSAQVPFSAWLPKAMAAPTPVSALVHSSTLVTAGVYLLIRLNYLMSSNLLQMMMLISSLTLILSSLSACSENDVKKIVALSTLSQLAVMIFCLSIELSEIAFFHLVIHAIFKSMLFLCMGIIIHHGVDFQDIRKLGMIMYNLPLVSVIFNCSIFSLMGIPFMSGFFSKDLILELYLMNLKNFFYFSIVFFSMGCTVWYSVRIICYSFVGEAGWLIWDEFEFLSSLMIFSMLLLFIMAVTMGIFLSLAFFSFSQFVSLPMHLKMLIYNFMMGGYLSGMFFPKIYWSQVKFKLSWWINYYFSGSWFTPIVYSKCVYQIFNYTFFLFKIENSWNEFKWGIFLFLKKLYKMEFHTMFYFNLIFFLVYLMLGMMI